VSSDRNVLRVQARRVRMHGSEKRREENPRSAGVQNTHQAVDEGLQCSKKQHKQ
jgi:hypothetical protein